MIDIAKYTTNATGVLPTFNSGYTGYIVDEIDNGDGTYNVEITTDNSDILPTTISFRDKTGLLKVGYLNVSGVTDMRNMFNGCNNLTSLDASGFDTSNVTDIGEMFQDCKSLTSLDLSGFDTSKVTDMNSMFQNCINLTSIDLSGFNTSNVTSMAGMFQDCNKLNSIDVSGFDTSNVTNMRYMFYGCKILTSLDVSVFDTSKVTDMSYMFNNCSKLSSLDLSGFDTSKVTNMRDMFYNCKGLTSLDLSGFDTGNVTAMNNMFNGCSQLITVYLINSSASTINDFIHYLPTKISAEPGEMFISDNVGISSVDVTSANIKDWNIVIVVESIDANAIKKVYYFYATVSKISIGSKTIKRIYTYKLIRESNYVDSDNNII